MLLFGESKISNNLLNGIKLLNKSLKEYEKEIREEFILVLSEENINKKGLKEIFDGKHEVCLTFDEFIKETGMDSIGVPLFVAHGQDLDCNVILKTLKEKVNKKTFFNLKTTYFVISLPIIDKSEFIKFLTVKIKNKIEEYI